MLGKLTKNQKIALATFPSIITPLVLIGMGANTVLTKYAETGQVETWRLAAFAFGAVGLTAMFCVGAWISVKLWNRPDEEPATAS